MTDNDTYHQDCEGPIDSEGVGLVWRIGQPPDEVSEITTQYGDRVYGVGGSRVWRHVTGVSFNPEHEKWVPTKELLSAVRHER